MSYFLPPPGKLPESRHSAVGGWFFGPRGENVNILREAFEFIVDENHRARETLYPHDKEFITDVMKGTALYQEQIEKLKFELGCLTRQLSDHTVPFWSPRYNAHMSMENSMPAVIGYLAGLIHNQNNVATEASPLTTILELKVGSDLCRMLGYNVVPSNDDPSLAVGWGHITCGGSVANLESIWSARNLKFYPLSLNLAIAKGPKANPGKPPPKNPLAFLKDVFKVELCTGEKKKFMECSTWELLNLKPSTVLNIPTQLYQEFGVSQTVLGNVLSDWNIQTVGKDDLEKLFNIQNPARMFVGTTKHYSWPKGGAIAGIGSAQIVDVPVDDQARMDPAELRKKLDESLKTKQAIYSVVAIIGSTEHGAVDPLDEVVALRTEYEKKGLSFIIHCDGAWGGYFTSLIREKEEFPNFGQDTRKGKSTYVPAIALSPYTERQLNNLRHADSITIDPHKSGYCPYPAGGLCYRDGRQRFLVTWTSPVVFRGNINDETEQNVVQSIGVYGVEGSKPGAAPVGAWLSHSILGLHKEGYGTLLGEAILTCSRLYCHWATMEPKPIKVDNVEARLIVRPFTLLPAERHGGDVEQQKQFIRDHILSQDNETIFKDKKAVDLLKAVGGDIQINNFACNFEIDGKVNTDVIEANYLNTAIFNAFSVTSINKKVGDVPLFLTSTQFSQEAYKGCLTKYKDRLGLKGKEDLYTLINVTMGPWSTAFNFLQTLADAFEKTAHEALEAVVRRNVQTPDNHGFIVQGVEGSRICGVHLPMFNMQNHRWQLIISCSLPEKELNEIRKRKKANPAAFFTFGNTKPEELSNLIKDGASFQARMDEGIPMDNAPPIFDDVKVSDVKVLYKRSMQHQYLESDYPDQMTFYAYSAQRESGEKGIFHVDHLLDVSPNIQLNADTVTFTTDNQARAEDIVKKSGAWFTLTDVHESALQPLIQSPSWPKTSYDVPGLGWKPDAEYAFEARAVKDGNKPPSPGESVLFKGKLKLGSSVFADQVMINADGGAHEQSSVPTAILGEPGINGSGLVDEHPTVDSAVPELRYLYQQSRMQNFEQQFEAARVREARKLIDSRKDGEVPGWVQAICDDAGDHSSRANGYKKGDANGYTKLYHSHA